MKKIPSILIIAIFLLAGSRASGQMVDSCKCDCGALFSSGYIYQSEGAEPQGYDTLKAFMEQCPLYPNSPEGFNMLNGAIYQWSAGGAGRWPDFLSWLKKVLYYNPDTAWYCGDVLDMLNAVQSIQASESICRYILQSGKCPVLASDFQTTLNALIQNRHKLWLDSLQYSFDSTYGGSDYYWADSIGEDTLAHPFTDTVVPTLFQDSLQILLGPQYAGVSAPSPITSEALLSAQLLENPMKDEIDISYEMGRTALVTMELRDVLGRSVPIANAKYQLEQPGDHNTTIPAPNLPPGTYYLRITTDAGDAITLKIVKE